MRSVESSSSRAMRAAVSRDGDPSDDRVRLARRDGEEAVHPGLVETGVDQRGSGSAVVLDPAGLEPRRELGLAVSALEAVEGDGDLRAAESLRRERAELRHPVRVEPARGES